MRNNSASNASIYLDASGSSVDLVEGDLADNLVTVLLAKLLDLLDLLWELLGESLLQGLCRGCQLMLTSIGVCATYLGLSAVATHASEGGIASGEGRGPQGGRTKSDGGHDCLCLCFGRGVVGVVNLG